MLVGYLCTLHFNTSRYPLYVIPNFRTRLIESSRVVSIDILVRGDFIWLRSGDSNEYLAMVMVDMRILSNPWFDIVIHMYVRNWNGCGGMEKDEIICIFI